MSFKRLFYNLIVAMGLVAVVAPVPMSAVNLEGNPPPSVSMFGSGLYAGSAIIEGMNPGDQSCTGGFSAYADVDITAGDVVILSSGTTYPVAVSKVASAGSIQIVGVAITTASYGTKVQVCYNGTWRVSSAINSTIRGLMITSATAGKVTASSAVTEDSYTALSQTAFIMRAAETKTISASDNKVLMHIGR